MGLELMEKMPGVEYVSPMWQLPLLLQSDYAAP